MIQALYTALYEDNAPFQWIHLTPHGVVRGAHSPAWYGWRPF